jgi:S1-C subfamily serine protease
LVTAVRGDETGEDAEEDLIQIDASINRGSSGGPSFDAEGNVISVNTMIFSPTGSVERRGVIVIGIDPVGRAADLGAEAGDIILEVGGKAVQMPDDIRDALDKAGGAGHHAALMRLKSGNAIRFVAVPVDPACTKKPRERALQIAHSSHTSGGQWALGRSEGVGVPARRGDDEHRQPPAAALRSRRCAAGARRDRRAGAG